MKSLNLAYWIGLLLFSVYLLSFSGKLHVMDEFVGFAVGNNLVQHGRADVNQFIWTNHWHTTPPGLWGQDNNLYTKKAPGISVAAMPLIWLGHTLPGLNAVHLGLLVSAIVTAATGSLLFIWLSEQNFSRPIASLAALGYGLATLAWVYARFLWEHSVMAFLFLATAWALYRAFQRSGQPGERSNDWWPVLLCGALMAVALSMRFEAIFAVGLVGLYLFLTTPAALEDFSWNSLRRAVTDKQRWGWLAVYSALPAATLLGLLYFNAIRFGSAGETGYNREILFHKPWEGSFGLLFSPSTGLFIYAPLTLLLFGGIWPAWRRLPRLYFGLITALVVFYWIFYGSWFSWGSTWVWGPRFMLHGLPLLMLFVAEALAWGSDQARRLWARPFIWAGAAVLTVTGFIINFLGVVVDLNEHFLRLGRNDNFVFNWEAFPPLGHWRILQEGLVDIIWLQPSPTGLTLIWPILAPALILFSLALIGLLASYPPLSPPRPTHYALRITFYVLLPLALVYWQMLGTASIALANPQAQADQPLLDLLAASAQPQDSLLVAMPPFGDVQEISTHLMAYLDRPLPTYAWIESEPKAIQPDERERLWQAVQAEGGRAWLLERWLTPKDPLSLTADRFNRQGFPVQEWWFEQSGKLTLYALADGPATISNPVNVPFQGGVQLVEFAVFGESEPGQILKVRLTWQAGPPEQLAAADLPEGGLVSFVHLVDEGSAGNAAQQDRLLLDLREVKRSPLQPGQTLSLGYGLRLPDNLPSGSYPLIIGLYGVSTGQRLPRADGSPDDFLYLTNITIKWGD
jgi:hypothetical protein